MGRPESYEHPHNEWLVRVLEGALGRGAKIDTYGRPVAPTGATNVLGANAYLMISPNRPGLELSIYPADTLEQARAFYPTVNVLAALGRLRTQTPWEAKANFHFGHFTRGYCWTCNERDVEEYVALWVRRIGREAAVPRSGWDAYWSWLESERIACARDYPEFERVFVRSNRPSAVPRPGLALTRRWPHANALARGRDGDLVDEVQSALAEALGTLSP